MINRALAGLTNIILLLFALLAVFSGIRLIGFSRILENGGSFITTCPCKGTPNIKSGVALIILGILILTYLLIQELRNYRARRLDKPVK